MGSVLWQGKDGVLTELEDSQVSGEGLSGRSVGQEVVLKGPGIAMEDSCQEHSPVPSLPSAE